MERVDGLPPYYDVAFKVNALDYGVQINALTGSVISVEPVDNGGHEPNETENSTQLGMGEMVVGDSGIDPGKYYVSNNDDVTNGTMSIWSDGDIYYTESFGACEDGNTGTYVTLDEGDTVVVEDAADILFTPEDDLNDLE